MEKGALLTLPAPGARTLLQSLLFPHSGSSPSRHPVARSSH